MILSFLKISAILLIVIFAIILASISLILVVDYIEGKR